MTYSSALVKQSLAQLRTHADSQMAVTCKAARAGVYFIKVMYANEKNNVMFDFSAAETVK